MFCCCHTGSPSPFFTTSLLAPLAWVSTGMGGRFKTGLCGRFETGLGGRFELEQAAGLRLEHVAGLHRNRHLWFMTTLKEYSGH